MKAKELMTKAPVSCTTHDDANRAAQLMWDHDCGFVVVQDPEGRVAGVVTDRDLCMAAYTRGLPLALIRVIDVMARDVKSCAPDEELANVALKMRLHQIRRLPVVDAAGKLVGVLSLNDVARRAALERGNARPRVTEELVAETLAVISRLRNGISKSVVPVVDELVEPSLPAVREPDSRRALIST